MRKRIITAFLAFIVFTTSSTSVAMATSSAGIRQIEGIPQLVTHLTHAMQELRLYASTVSGTPEAKMYELALVTNMYKYLYYIVSFDELSRDLYSIVPESIGISQAEIFLLVRDVGYIAESFVLTHNVSNLRLEYDDSMSANDRIADLRAQLSEKLGYIIPRIVVEDLEPLLFELEQNSNALSPQYTESILLRYREIAYWANEIANSLHEYREDFEILYALNAPRANDRDAVPGLADILLNTLIGQLNFPVDITDGLWGAISDHRGVSMITLEALREILSLASQAVLSPPGSDNAGVRIKQDIEYYIQALVNVQRNPGVEDNDFSLAAWDILGSNVQLSAAYTAMLASTAVYTPFRSKVGDEDYIQALRFLVEGTSVPSNEANTLIEFFNQIKDIRKPLYVQVGPRITDATEALWGTSSNVRLRGTATRAKLGDMIYASETGNIYTFFTVKGRFEPGVDMSSWAFYQSARYVGVGEGQFKSTTVGGANVVIPAGNEVSGEIYTAALYEMGDSDGVYLMGQLLFTNAYRDLRNTSFLTSRQDALLYMNVFGDIVLSDNTVIIPGAANPLMYSFDGAYNPYTVAFMNAYPRLAQDVNYLRVQSSNDFDKYMLIANKTRFWGISSNFSSLNNWQGWFTAEDVAWSNYRWTNLGIGEGVNPGSLGLVERSTTGIFFFDHLHLSSRKIRKSEDFVLPQTWVSLSVFPFFFAGVSNSRVQLMSFLRLANSDQITAESITGQEISDLIDYAITFEQVMMSDGYTVFPYSADENMRKNDNGDADYRVPKLIAQNMYWYYMYNGSSLDVSDVVHNGNLRAQYIYENIIIEMLQGSSFVSTFERNIDVISLLNDYDSNDKYVEQFRSVAQNLMDNVQSFDGVLGIRPADSNMLFGRVLSIVREWAWVLFAGFMVIFLFRYMKRGDMLYSVIMVVVSAVFLYLFLFFLPVYLPVAYNALSRNLTEGMVGDVVLYNAERYSSTYEGAKKITEEGDYDIQTVSISLYRMTETQILEFVQGTAPDRWEQLYNAFRYGGRVIIDPEQGTFLQGDSIKVNVDVMLLNNSITGEYVTISSDSGTRIAYQLNNTRRGSSNLEFYAPFHLLQRGLLETINEVLATWYVPRTTIDYLGGLTKDAYAVFNWTNSIPFLHPNRYQMIQGLTPFETIQLERNFGNAEDFLNMTWWVEALAQEPAHDSPQIAALRQTLWYNVMFNNGYYEQDSAQKRADLVEYVNYHTKRYILQNQPVVGMVSDENLIKIISMQAMFYFNQFISEWGEQANPQRFNHEELRLGDVLLTALTQQNERFIMHNFNLVDYVATTQGMWGLVMLIIITVCALLFVVVVEFSLPVLYVLLGLLVTFRLITDKPLEGLFKGYFKTTALLIGIYSVFIAILVGVPKILSGMAMLVAMAILFLLLLLLFVTALAGFIGDIGFMGNRGLGQALRGNPLTGIFARPVTTIMNTVQNSWNRGYGDSSAEPFVESDNTIDRLRSNRRYIINSMETSNTSPTQSSTREPRITHSKSV